MPKPGKLIRVRYIGDGVHAGYDGYHFWLLTGFMNDGNERNAIALTDQVASQLKEYIKYIHKASVDDLRAEFVDNAEMPSGY